jgi:PadR family transcriptional regulator PadR
MYGGSDHHDRGLGPPRSHSKPRRHFRSLPERGWIQLLTLRIIHERPMHGYQLIDEMERKGYVQSGRFETGSIYTILSRMEKRGLLTSEQATEAGRVRRVYSVTERGAEVLAEGLRAIIRRKAITDKLVNYYNERFASEGKSSEANSG